MRMIRTTDSKEHLCTTCVNWKILFPECLNDDVEFGNGVGNDNIIACNQCLSPYSDTIYPTELK